MKCVEMLRELLREQIQRNTDLHILLSQQIDDVNEARRERDEALESLSNVRRELSRLIYGESIGTQLAIENLEILAKRKEEKPNE